MSPRATAHVTTVALEEPVGGRSGGIAPPPWRRLKPCRLRGAGTGCTRSNSVVWRPMDRGEEHAARDRYHADWPRHGDLGQFGGATERTRAAAVADGGRIADDMEHCAVGAIGGTAPVAPTR